jgi:NADPH-dependent glutamate synthase beta subunit-like oxidoreductase
MATITIKIDDQPIECFEEMTILEAADSAGIYIPRLCYHPDLPPTDQVICANFIFQGKEKIIGESSGEKIGEKGHCNLCFVKVDGKPEPVNSCSTAVEDGMAVTTETSGVIQRRKQALSEILAHHPHACLTCAQKQGCSRTDCSANVPVDERCCALLGRCTLEKISDYIGIPGDTPKYVPANRPVVKDDPLFDRDFNLCISCLRCVRICKDVRGVDALGAVWKDDRAWVGTLGGPGLNEAECRFCGACVEICPTGALMDKENVPKVRMDSPVPCVGECPAGIDIPRYVRLIAEGRKKEALELIRSRVPFPGILGYVCFHPCENVCRRGEVDEPVAICALKRYAAEIIPVEDYIQIHKQQDTGRKIAIIGSGPAGLTAAYYLSASGHRVDVFDEATAPGGMLRFGIPDYRLPSDVLERELEFLGKMGINFHMDQRIDSTFGISHLKDQGYEAILFAAGAPVSKTLPVENSDLDGIIPGLEFLKSAKGGSKPSLGGRVIVIGGGNVAIDAAMTASRLGAEHVRMVCLESRDEMPAHDWEIAQAEDEGIEISPSWGPARFVSGNGRVSGVELKRCVRVFNNQGAFDPQFDEDEKDSIPADYVIVTIGQEADPGLLQYLGEVRGKPHSQLTADEKSGIGIEGVFAAGDLVRGPSSVVDAIADGRRAAEAIDKYLGGSEIVDISPDSVGSDSSNLGTPVDSIRRPRQIPMAADPTARKSGFGLIEETFDDQTAVLEAQRCLQCHLRQMITPDVLPPERWLALNEETIGSVPESEGVFQLLDGEMKVIRISGTANLRRDLTECLADPGEARYLIWEEDPMYTKRESELIQQHLQKHGRLPGGNDLDDELF